MKYSYRTKDTCAVQIDFDMTDGIVSNIRFLGGCNGNLKMISKLLEGRRAEEIVSACSGNTCGGRKTSCADQLAKAVQSAINQAR